MYKVSIAAISIAAFIGLGNHAMADGYEHSDGYKDLPVVAGPVTTEWEFGTRVWFSTGENKYDIYDPDDGSHLSRLTWGNLDSVSPELFFRGDLPNRVFIKGYAGIGDLDSGNLIDEDFEPVTVPYSSTTSRQRGGALRYLNIDLGYTLLDRFDGYVSGLKDGFVAEGQRYRLGAFVGYHHWQEKVHAYDCTQTAGNPDICAPGDVAVGTLVITNDADWNALRLGMVGDIFFTPRLKLTAEAAYVLADLDGGDTHHLRMGYDRRAASDETGDGNGVQLEAILSYDLSKMLSIGIGGRYWRASVDNGTMTHHYYPTGDEAIPMDYKSERYGVFLQSSLKFGGPEEQLK